MNESDPSPTSEIAASATDATTVVVPTSKPRIWTTFAVFVLALVAITVGQVVFIVVFLFTLVLNTGEEEGPSPQSVKLSAQELSKLLTQPVPFTLLMAMNQAMIGLSALIPAWLSKTPLRERLGWLTTKLSVGEYAVIAMGTWLPAALGMALAVLLAQVIPPDAGVANLYKQMTPQAAVPFLLVIALAPGLCEELLFRGYIQRRLLERWSPRAAIGVTSLLFALLHITPHAIVFALMAGLWLGIVAWKTGSVWPGVVCHAFINGTWNMLQLVKKFELLPMSALIAVVIVFGIGAVVCFGLSVRMLFPRVPPSPLVEEGQAV